MSQSEQSLSNQIGELSVGEEQPVPQPIHTNKTPEELHQQQLLDKRSIFIRNLAFTTTPDELEVLCHPFGTVNRVTILFDKYTGKSKGYAYLEYEDEESALKAIEGLNGQEFKGRVIGVLEKRTNLPGLRAHRGRGRGRGRGRRGPSVTSEVSNEVSNE
jgi:polyadenylate-binding protein 2